MGDRGPKTGKKKVEVTNYMSIKALNGLSINDRLVGLVVKASASRMEDPGFESRLRRDFLGVESYQ